MNATRRPAIDGSAVATGKGDDGTTGLLYGGPRIAKDDPRAEAYGTIDEAVAALGVARAALVSASAGTEGRAPTDDGEAAETETLGTTELAALILRLQRQLFVVGAELATTPDAWPRLEDDRTRVSETMLDGLESVLADLEGRIAMPTEFVVPGETPASAALELARTILRRAERRATTLEHDHLVPGPWLLPYLNRLADLVWVMARVAEAAEAAPARPAVQGGRRVRAST